MYPMLGFSVLMAFAPLINYGSWLAAFAYGAGNSPSMTGRIAGEAYEFTYAVFAGLKPVLPCLDDLNLANLFFAL